MDKAACRVLDCGMSFATSRQRDQHQNLMHPEWVKHTAILLVDKINATNSSEALQKKILRTSERSFSYAEAKQFINTEEDPAGKAILKTMMSVVETYFTHHDDWGVNELIKISDFRIN
jgi:hypothetical protein